MSQLVLPLLASTIVYFVLNSGLTALAIGFERATSPIQIWKRNFLWLSINYFGGASLAALLVGYTRHIDLTYLGIIVPLLLVMYLTYKTSMARVEDANQHLTQMNALYLSTIETLAMAIDAKDQVTHGHIRRVQLYASGLARAVGLQNEPELRAVEAAALLHDMGKLAIPEYILNKPGKLTPAEFEKMKRHASIGADILSSIDFPYPVVPIVRHHHENWDGNGYPDGLKGEDIPLGARVLSVVDCFDALTSDRPYRPRLPDEEAIRILRERAGTMYDPTMVETFERIYKTISPTEREYGSRHAYNAIKASGARHEAGQGRKATLDDITASTEEMLTVYELARSLTKRVTLSDAGDIIAKHLKKLLPASLCVYYIYDSDRDELVAKHASGDHADLVSGLRIGMGQRLTGWVAANRQTILNSDPVLDFGDTARSLKPRPRSCLSTPLVVESDLVGVLSLYGPEREAFSDDHQRIAEMIAKQVSQILWDASTFDSVRQASLRDAVTGLPNVDQLRSFFRSSTSSPSYREQGLSLVLVNVGGLGTVNSRFGRGTGDRLLSAVAEAIGRSLRGADIVFRYGGDEFVVLLEQTDDKTCQVIAGRISEAASTQFLHRFDLRTVVGVGVATAPGDGQSLDKLTDVARSRLRASVLHRETAVDTAQRVH